MAGPESEASASEPAPEGPKMKAARDASLAAYLFWGSLLPPTLNRRSNKTLLTDHASAPSIVQVTSSKEGIKPLATKMASSFQSVSMTDS